jgi:large subunit ribosomal protein L16
VLFELEGVPVELARRAMELASAKHPVKTKFFQRGLEDQ